MNLLPPSRKWWSRSRELYRYLRYVYAHTRAHTLNLVAVVKLIHSRSYLIDWHCRYQNFFDIFRQRRKSTPPYKIASTAISTSRKNGKKKGCGAREDRCRLVCCYLWNAPLQFVFSLTIITARVFSTKSVGIQSKPSLSPGCQSICRLPARTAAHQSFVTQ